MNRPRIAALLVILAAAACDKPPPKPEAVDPVSGDEAVAFARAFEEAVEPCDGAKLAALLDSDTVIRRAVHAADVKKVEREQVYKGMMSERDSMAENLCGNWRDGSTFELLRIRDGSTGPAPLFRNHGDTGLNYLELELGKSKKDGKVRIVDFYIYTAGEKLSETFSRLITTGMGAYRSGGDAGGLEKVAAARDRGDVEEARRLLRTLPKGLRESKQIRLIELQMVTGDDADYLSLIEEFEKAFPDDPAIDMVSIDGFMMRKDVAGAIKILERLERRVGGDPYLDFMRANVYLIDPTPEYLAAAEKTARNAVTGMPDDQTVHITLLTVLATRKDYAGAIAALDVMSKKFDLDIAALAGEEPWDQLLASREYTTWANAQ